jgi:hypothetical protein
MRKAGASRKSLYYDERRDQWFLLVRHLSQFCVFICRRASELPFVDHFRPKKKTPGTIPEALISISCEAGWTLSSSR